MLITMDELNLVHNLSFVRTKKIKEVKRPATNPKSEETRPVVIKQPIIPVERSIQKISEVVFTGDSLLLSIYDNGTIDGDTVSMVLNGRTIVERVKLTTSAYKVTIPTAVKPGDTLILIMHAESLGLIPPNTGLLIIEDGATRHEIRFEGDLQRSSAVTLRKKRPVN
jgi:hypothetical protein